MASLTLTGRNSRLSLLQIELVRNRILRAFPEMEVKVVPRSSRGDALIDVPLQTVEGSDFFTADIFAALENGQADIAVHSLKDMSADHFFGPHVFAVPDRDDTRDLAIFHPQIEEKLKAGTDIVMGTCSPRRELMATEFLQQALPQWNNAFRVITRFIRGNVDSRLRKLDAGEYDGIILATAGLNRLLRSEADAPAIRTLLADKRLMFLPLVECVPAPCQGAIVAEALPENTLAGMVLNAINQPDLLADCVREKQVALQYGKGCDQPFGVSTLTNGKRQWLYAAGRRAKGKDFARWYGLPEPLTGYRHSVSTADHMGRFFEYNYLPIPPKPGESVCFVANYKAIPDNHYAGLLAGKRVWASGSKTWKQLAQKGIWVEGCSDGLGLESLNDIWRMPLLNIHPDDLRILTHEAAAHRWTARGRKATALYRLVPQPAGEWEELVQKADLVFWTSYAQFEQYRHIVKAGAKHACLAGETAQLLREADIDPIEFPTIKAFQQWSNSGFRLPSAA